MTPHNRAKKEEIARTVIMPGDPLRAKWIAETKLKDAVLVNDVRGMLAFTGTYKGMPLTVMAHGMGIPSIGIYTYELFKFYDVETIIRIGSAGTYTPEINVGDVIIAEESVSYSQYAADIGVETPGDMLLADKVLVERAKKTADKLKIKTECCRVFCSDSFYNKYNLQQCIEISKNSKAVEMEGFALYANAALFKRNALVLLTCSDSFVTGEALSIQARQGSLDNMVNFSFEFALSF